MTDPQLQENRTSRSADDLTGTAVGRFAVRARLGGGGMGEVYRADDTKLKRPVALKRMAPELRADERYRRRFLNEAERASALSYEHIAGVYDVMEENGELFLVMELVEGETLRRRLHRPHSPKEILPIAVQCAEALVEAAKKRIVHCDIKPENIMLTPAGQVKILDFGVARRVVREEEGTTTTSTESTAGGLSGTVGYMAPEVLLGREPDTRADIFSLGVVLYEALTRRHPFRSDTFVATADRILHDAPVPMRRLNSQVPAELERIVHKMLAKDPEERYATAADLVVDLRAVDRSLSHPGEYAPAAAPAHHGWWPVAGAAGVVLLALLVVVVPTGRETVQEWLGVSGLPAEKNLAVLPFVNVGSDPDNQPFCDGLTYTLTSKLTQLEQFHGSLLVVPASEVIQGGVLSVEEATRQFGVSLVLTGSVQRTEEGVLVNVNLVDAGSRRQLRSMTLEAGGEEPALLQGGLALQVARLLELELEDRDQKVLAAGHTGIVQAHDFYLQGHGYLQRYEKPENIEHAITQFQRAVDLDPTYALAFAGLGEAYWRKYEHTREAAWTERARQACQQALSVDDRLAAPHICLGMLYNGTGRYEKAVVEFQHALEREPGSDSAFRGLAKAQQSLGRADEAEKTYQRAIQLRPGYWGNYRELGVLYFRLGRYDDAAGMFQRWADLVPDSPRAYTSLGGIYYLQARWEEAERLYERSLEIEPTYAAYSNLGTIYFFQGRYPDAVTMFERAAELQATDYILIGNLADAYRWTRGQKGKAAATYRRAIQMAEERLAVNPRAPDVHSDLAVYWAKLGEREKALQEIAQARHEGPDDVNIMYKSALVYHLVGQREQALEALDEAIKAGYPVAEIQADPELADLRADLKSPKLIQSN